MTKIKFEAKVTSVQERFESHHVSGVGDDAAFSKVSIGWFIGFEGSWELIHVGTDKPETKIGDVATIEISLP